MLAIDTDVLAIYPNRDRGGGKVTTVKIREGKIELSPLLVEWLGTTNELAMWVEGDTLILKKLTLPRLSELAEWAPNDEEMPMDEIVAEVHRYRQERGDASRR